MPDLEGPRGRLPHWAHAALFQFASGVAIAVGLVGVARNGRDVWLGAALIVMAAAFAFRGIALSEQARAEEASALRHELQQLGARLPDASPVTGKVGPRLGWRRWLARFGR